MSADVPVPRLSTSSRSRLRRSGPKIPRYSTRVPVDGYPGPPSTATRGGLPRGPSLAGSQRKPIPMCGPAGRAGSSRRRIFPHIQRVPSGHGRSTRVPTFMRWAWAPRRRAAASAVKAAQIRNAASRRARMDAVVSPTGPRACKGPATLGAAGPWWLREERSPVAVGRAPDPITP